jgi:hypothetical protein
VITRSLILIALCMVTACTTASFRPTFKSPERPKAEQIATELASVPPRTERSVIVAVAAEGKELIAWDLEKGLSWRAGADVRSAPLIAGNYVITQEGEAVVVRDLGSGVKRASLDDGGKLVGADGEGDAAVISLAYASAENGEPQGEIVYVAGGSVRWAQELKLAVGTPALARGYVLVPWATHRLSVLDTRDGAELARWYFNAAVLGHTQVEDGRVYVGQHGLLRVRPELLAAKLENVTMIAPSPRTLPGQPPLLLDGYAPVPEPSNAQHRVRLSFRVGDNDGLDQGMFFARFYRIVLGLNASDDQVRFARVLERDVIGAQATAHGLMVVDEGGGVQLINHAGQAQPVAQLPAGLVAASVRARGYAPAPAAAGATPAPAMPPLEQQLLAAALVDDSRLAMGRQYAVEQLARSASAEVTGQLIAMCSDAKSPESVRRAACIRMTERDKGGDAVLATLRNADGARPSLGALAKAAAHLELKAAAPLLLPHVLDPRTPPGELARLIEALGKLQHAPAAPVIDRFLRLHHAEPETAELGPALQAAAIALAELRAKSFRATLERVHADNLASENVRKSAGEALLALDAPPVKAQPAAVAAAPQAPAAAPVAPADTRPRYLSTEIIDAALKPVRHKLVSCLGTATGVSQARVAMTIDGQGAVERVFVSPADRQACIEPIVRAQKFPATQQGRQNVSHMVRVRPDKPVGQKPGKLASLGK